MLSDLRRRKNKPTLTGRLIKSMKKYKKEFTSLFSDKDIDCYYLHFLSKHKKRQRLFAAASKKMMGFQATPVAKNLSDRRRLIHAADYC